jgi:hypothetical protein
MAAAGLPPSRRDDGAIKRHKNSALQQKPRGPLQNPQSQSPLASDRSAPAGMAFFVYAFFIPPLPSLTSPLRSSA